jgi:hypothetical protein
LFFLQPEANSGFHKESGDAARATVVPQGDYDGDDTYVGESNSFLDRSVSTAGGEPGSPLI